MRPQPHAGRGQITLEGTRGHVGPGRSRRGRALVDGFDRARPLQPAQRRVQRPERDAPERPQRLRQALLQVVAVARLLGEQPEDRELQHAYTIYRIDISMQVPSTPHPGPAIGVAKQARIDAG